MPDVIRETDEYVRYDMSFDDIIDAAEQVEAAAEGYTDLDTRLDGMDNEIDQAKQAIHFKGFVNYYADLPNDAEENDAYTVLYSGSSGTDPDGTEYVYSDYEGSLSWNPWGKQTYSQSQIDTFLSAKQDTVTAGTGLAFGTGAAANTLGHSNTVTAKATQGFAQIAYDAQGHITGSTAATTAQANAINSGIDSTKVAQIETNKTNILLNWQTGKNKLENTITVGTTTSFDGKINVTTNADKSITLTRTASSSSTQFITINDNVYLEAGEYVFFGCPSGGSGTTYEMRFLVPDGSTYIEDKGDGATFTLSTAGTISAVAIRIGTGFSPNAQTYYPMIISKALYDSGFYGYQPFALPNTTLTDDALACYDRGALNRNLLELTAVTTTSSGITFTINADKSITLSGTRDGDSPYINLRSPATFYSDWGLSAGDKVILCARATTDKCCMTVIPYSTATGLYGNGTDVTTNDIEYTLPANYDKLLVRASTKGVTTGQTASGTLYPMICLPETYKRVKAYQPYSMSNVELTKDVTTLNQASQYNMAGTYDSETGRATFAALYRLALEALGLDTSVLHHYIVHLYTNTVSPTPDLLIMYGTYRHNNTVSHAVLYNSQISYYADNTQGTLVVSGGDSTIHASVRFLD